MESGGGLALADTTDDECQIGDTAPYEFAHAIIVASVCLNNGRSDQVHKLTRHVPTRW